MNSGCFAIIGDLDNGGVSFSNDQILACSFIENLSNLPNGRIIIKVPSIGLDDLINIPSGVNITVRLSSFEDPDNIPSETTIVVKGTVIKHYSSSIDLSLGTPSGVFSTYVIDFMVAGNNMSYLQLIKGTAILNTSIGAIRKLGKLTNSQILFDDSSIKINDMMKWLIVNRNLVTAIDLITNRSYISEDDALFSCFKLDGSIRIGSIKTSYDKSTSIVYNYASSRFDIVNTPTSVKGGSQLVYAGFDITHSSVIKQSIATTGITRIELPINGKNIKQGKAEGIRPTGTDVEGSVNGTSINVLGKINPRVGKHPNTHDMYGIAPQIRSAVFSNFSHEITLIASGESLVNVGDVINVLIPTIGTQASGGSEVLYSKTLSGKYFVHSKQYQFGNGSRFTVILKLMKSDILYDKSKYFEQLGIGSDSVK